MICENCQKGFYRPHRKNKQDRFCSRSCSTSFFNRTTQKRKPKKRFCKICHSLYYNEKGYRSNVFCPKCSAKYKIRMQSVTLKTYHNFQSVKGKPRFWINAHIRRFNRYWNKELLNFPCQVCNYKKHVELCHIHAISDFPEEAKISIVNSPKNSRVGLYDTFLS